MATASTASSGTDDREPPGSPDAGAPGAPDASASGASGAPDASAPDETLAGRPEASVSPSPAQAATSHDAARRAFFRQFGRQAVTTAGQVVGMVDMVNRASGSAAASLLGLTGTAPRRPGGALALPAAAPARVVPHPQPADSAYRSPFRIVGDELHLLDQRGIPVRLDDVVARRGSDVAYHLRLGVVRGGPLVAQAAAFGLALTARERLAQPRAVLDAELLRTERALVAARPSARLPGWAVERMARARAALGAEADGAAIAAALWAEAEAITGEIQAGHATIAVTLAERLRGLGRGALAVLVHGDPGGLHGGLVGTAIPALRQLRDEGRALRVFVTESRPLMEGARLASWELRQAGIEHRVVPDAAVAWLFAEERIDVVLLAAEWVAANGDTAALVGARAVAQLAAAADGGPERFRPLVIASALSATIDAATPDGSAIPPERLPVRDQVAFLSGVPIEAGYALVPARDVIPASLVGALVTERGVAAPLTAEAVIDVLQAAPSPVPETSG